MPALLTKYKAYEAVLNGQVKRPGVPITAIETEQFGVQHAQVGAYFASSWHLDEAVWLAILLHHDYSKWEARAEEMPIRIAAMGLVAEQVVNLREGHDCDEWDQGGEIAMEILDLGPAQLDDFKDELGVLLNGS